MHEALQKVSDPLIKMCPECGKLKLKKLVSAPSFRLSGTGWYETDFKSDKDKKRNLASNDSQKEGQKEGKEKSDSGQSKSENGKSKDSKSKTDSKETGKKSSTDKPKAKSKKSK